MPTAVPRSLRSEAGRAGQRGGDRAGDDRCAGADPSQSAADEPAAAEDAGDGETDDVGQRRRRRIAEPRTNEETDDE